MTANAAAIANDQSSSTLGSYLDRLAQNFAIEIAPEPQAAPDWDRYVMTSAVCKAVMNDVLAAAGFEDGVVGLTRRQLAFCVMVDVILARFIAGKVNLPTHELAAMKAAAELARDHDVMGNLDVLSRVVEYGIAWLGYMEKGGKGEDGVAFVESLERLLAAYAENPGAGLPDKLVSGVQSLLESVGQEADPVELSDDYDSSPSVGGCCGGGAKAASEDGESSQGGCCGGGCGCG